MVGVLAVVMSLAFAGMVIGRYLVASHGAQQAADQAALSGAAAVQHGGAACPRVKAMAAANGAELVGCDQVGDQLDFVVTARVRVAVDAARVPGLPRAMEATAYAGVVS
jgi:secretion/DNA translocation related TadE-like protein